MEDDAGHGLWLQIVDGFAFEGEARLRFDELLRVMTGYLPTMLFLLAEFASAVYTLPIR